ncbi:MAG: DnaA/Hda family protein [Chlamydiota bacterium]
MKLWESFLHELEPLLGRENTDRWLRSLEVVRFDARNIYLKAADAFHIHWFEQHVRKHTKKLKNGSDRSVQVHLLLPQAPTRCQPNVGNQPWDPDPLLQGHQFSSFHITEENRLTYSILEDSEESSCYNPIFLHGPESCGKTHLLMAAAHRFLSAGYRVLYVRAETFTRHVVRAIQWGNMQPFRDRYRSADVLILEDVHILGRKKTTQEEVFHTFNALHAKKKRILLSSRFPPHELVEVEPRLTSRFEWGITLKLTHPERKDIEEILRRKSQTLGFPLKEGCLSFLVETFTTPTSLYTAFEALMLRTPDGGKKAEEVLADLWKKEQEKKLTVADILEVVSETLRIPQKDIMGKNQKAHVSFARKIATYFIRTKIALTWKQIGDIFSRNHSTIISGVRDIENTSPHVMQEIEKSLEKKSKKKPA